VRGHNEEAITTPFDMTLPNNLDRNDLTYGVMNRAPKARRK